MRSPKYSTRCIAPGLELGRSAQYGAVVGDVTSLLAVQADETFQRLRSRLDGLTDEEFSWEPAPGCWTVHRGPGGRWTYDYELPDPEPSPFTTIGWRLNHVALCKVMYHEHAFGSGELSWDTIETPGTVTTTIAELERGQSLLVDDLAALEDADLDGQVRTNWGGVWPAWRIFWTMIDHDAHHGGEIGVLRDLFRSRAVGGSADRD